MTRTCRKCKLEKQIDDFQIRKNTGRHYWQCKSCTVKRSTLWNKQNSNRRMAISAARRAKLQGVPFDLDGQWVVDHMTAECPCCQEAFRLGEPTGLGKIDNRLSLDRIVPELGYTKENTRIICTWCNIIKNDGTAHDHEMIAKWLLAGAPQYAISPTMGVYGDGI